MARIVLIYGSISGAVIIAAMVVGMILVPGESGVGSEWLGYLTMLVALSMIFVGIKRYRDTALGGVIKFGRAFALGLGIALVAGVAYVVAWEVFLAATDYAWVSAYFDGAREALQARGVEGAALEAELAKLDAQRAQYENPLFRVPVTFLEILPVGILVDLVSSGLLRNPKVLPARG